MLDSNLLMENSGLPMGNQTAVTPRWASLRHPLPISFVLITLLYWFCHNKWKSGELMWLGYYGICGQINNEKPCSYFTKCHITKTKVICIAVVYMRRRPYSLKYLPAVDWCASALIETLSDETSTAVHYCILSTAVAFRCISLGKGKRMS